MLVGTVSFPKAVAWYDYSHVRARLAFLSIVKPAAKRLHSHHREIIFRRQECKAATHLVIAPDAGNSEFKGGYISKYISAALAKRAVFVIRKLPIIMTRVLASCEQINDFGGPDRHHRLQQHPIDQRENGRVNTDCQGKRQYRYARKSRRLEKLSYSKSEILHHKEPSLFSLRCSLPPVW